MKGEGSLPQTDTPALREAIQEENLAEITAAPGTLDAFGGKGIAFSCLRYSNLLLYEESRNSFLSLSINAIHIFLQMSTYSLW